jgi:hypothetical protein
MYLIGVHLAGLQISEEEKKGGLGKPPYPTVVVLDSPILNAILCA